ncbi:MAG: DNA mismatch repair endonuclease MutL [Deltaproteobacteria bacterium]|nr:DNA mismatch repair endonuclease MutL [Deltaproteobacteria bacterium]MCL5277901.1 DNA mismatch repair endonuclease MutL [Deltaproteobacteria bacterium]
MGNIARLSDDLASKIAAGEVIERPASIVKELMENSVDAGAGSISVELGNGGIDYIRVRDDGDGILSEDMGLAVQRHATSKLRSELELYEIETLGFRGEALYSIGVVSELEIVTRHRTEAMGTRLGIRGGTVTDRSAVAHDRGTSVTVSSLFFNTPARKKFLGSAQAEYRACLDVVDRFIFGHSDIGIRLVHNSRESFTIQPAPVDMRAVLRIDQGLKDRLYGVAYDNGILRVDGFVSDPDYTTNSSRFVYLFVNKRYVIDKSLVYTITGAYSTSLGRGRYPVAIMNLSIPRHFVDVNVNPTKTAVKFSDKAMVYDALGRAVRDTIDRRSVAYSAPDPGTDRDVYRGETKEASAAYAARVQRPDVRDPGHSTMGRATAGRSVHPSPQQDLVRKGEFSSLNVHAQLDATYIIASSPDGMVLIDQHAMHERLLFEGLVRDSRTHRRQSQLLIAPQELFLNESRMSTLAEMQGALDTIGYGLTIGHDSVIVNAVPPGTVFTPLSFIELLDSVKNDDSSHTDLAGDQRTDPLYRIMADVACKSAVRAGDLLSVEKIKALFMQLDELGIPLSCPHGRPFVLVLSLAEIQKSFHRR